MIDQWQSCYDDGWQGDIVPEAFSHPAKFSHGLIHRIYRHAKEMGWFKTGDYVLDPFAGVALGGLEAMSHGLNWIGIELEEKFVSLGQQNIELWNRQLKGWPKLGTAKIMQGDSRYLRDIVFKGDLIVSSPPYTESQGVNPSKGIKNQKPRRLWNEYSIGKTEGQLANMSEGNFEDMIEKADLVVSSPPFKEQIGTSSNFVPLATPGNPKYKDRIYLRKSKISQTAEHGHTPGNLANLPEGKFEMVVSSPPYADSVNSGPSGIDHSKSKGGRNRAEEVRRTGCVSCQAIGEQRYGQSPGQLGSMKEGPFDICVSSPPYEESRIESDLQRRVANPSIPFSDDTGKRDYGNTSGNLGGTSGDTFWSASREIVQGCFDLLKPGGHAIWVCKDYVKAKKRVPFSDRWQALCESVGFKLACRHQAMLVKEHGTQMTSYGEEKITTERKSFFRRLAESKGSPRIDEEDIICLMKEI